MCFYGDNLVLFCHFESGYLLAVAGAQDIDALSEIGKAQGVLASSELLAIDVVNLNHSREAGDVGAHCDCCFAVGHVLNNSRYFNFSHTILVNLELVVAIGGDVVVRQLLSIVPVVEDEVIVATLGVEQEHFVNC